MEQNLYSAEKIQEQKKRLYREIDSIYYGRQDLKAFSIESEEIILRARTNIEKMLAVTTHERIIENVYGRYLEDAQEITEGLELLDKLLKRRSDELNDEVASLRRKEK